MATNNPPPPTLPEASCLSTQTWQNDLLQLFHNAKDRFPDVAWELHPDNDHDSTEEVWGHKAIVYARVPPSFQARYFSFHPAPITSPTPYSASASPAPGQSSASLNVTPDHAHNSRSPSPSTNQGGLLRIPQQMTPTLFSNELEYLYSGKGLGEAFEFLFDTSESRDDADAEETCVDKLRKDLVFMWRSRLYCDIRISLTGTFSTFNPERTTAIFSSHRFILVSRSLYFRTQLLTWGPNSALGEPLTVSLPSPPFTPASLHFTLGYIYTGTLVFSHQTYDLDTAFAILRSANYLQLPQLYNETQARIVYEMVHGLYHAFLEFDEYERITNAKWGIGGCRCRQCARRVPRVLEFALSDDVANKYLERGCRRALVGLFGEGWCNAEFVALPLRIRVSIVKAIRKRTTPTNVFPLLFAAQCAMKKLDFASDAWADVSREMILVARKTIDEYLVKESKTCFEQPEWVEVLGSNGGGIEDGERVGWVMEALKRGLSDCYAATVYETLVASILLRPHATEVDMTVLSQTSQVRAQVEETRVDLLKWIRKRWMGIRQEGGFDTLEEWSIKEISSEIEVSVEDLLSPRPYNTPRNLHLSRALRPSLIRGSGDADPDSLAVHSLRVPVPLRRTPPSRSRQDEERNTMASVTSKRNIAQSTVTLRPTCSAVRSHPITSRANERRDSDSVLDSASVTAVLNGVMGTPRPRHRVVERQQSPLLRKMISTRLTERDPSASEKESDQEENDNRDGPIPHRAAVTVLSSPRPSTALRSITTSRSRSQGGNGNPVSSVRVRATPTSSSSPRLRNYITASRAGERLGSKLTPDLEGAPSVRPGSMEQAHVGGHVTARRKSPLTNTTSTSSRVSEKDDDEDYDGATPLVTTTPNWRPTLAKITITNNTASTSSASASTEWPVYPIRPQRPTVHSSNHPSGNGLSTHRTPSSAASPDANLSPATSDTSFGTAPSELNSPTSTSSDKARSREVTPDPVVYERPEAVDHATHVDVGRPTTEPVSHFTQDSTLHLREWAKLKLAHDPWKDAVVSAPDCTLPRVTIYQIICERLEINNSITDAVECLHQMTNELGAELNIPSEHSTWDYDFRQRSCKKLEHLGDTAVDAQRYEEAISHYTTALSLNIPSLQNIFLKRSKANIKIGSWKQALDDADQVITLDPLSPWGYEMKHAALHEAGDYNKAVDAFETMLSNMERSPDPDIRQCRNQYKIPTRIRLRIRRIIQRTLRDSPQILIDTTTGRLYNRDERASAFESHPIFNELVSSMTTHIDRARIKHEVRQYFRYVMLSHKWEENEPSFQQVIHIAVYDLDQCPTHDKLQMFCKIVQDAGFQWAWSDTCCIDTGKHDVHQEALVAMFKWYRGSAMMIVFLRGVPSSSQCGALAGSIWNTRGWTLQEYIAAKVIRFYTEDWTLYLNLESPNHKEAPEVISEMEQSTGVPSQQLMTLRPGLTSVREKLRLASMRQTTRVEDAAYSLLGIFSVTGIPAIYGEGEAALGRLLSHILTGSGDVSILAWTGESGSFNSCLPAHITVFNRLATSHLPPPIEESEMGWIVASQTSSIDLDVALKLYDHLNELSAPWFAASRMKLPCIVFQLPSLGTPHRTRSGRIYHVDTVTFGMVKIKTRHELSRMNSLYLVHPWLDTLLEPEHVQGIEDHDMPPPSPDTDDGEISDEEIYRYSMPPDPASPSRAPRVRSMHMVSVPMDKETRARRLVARLRQPFGALLVTPTSTGRRAMDYRRVAADSSIIVRFQDTVPLTDLLNNVRILDIL